MRTTIGSGVVTALLLFGAAAARADTITFEPGSSYGSAYATDGISPSASEYVSGSSTPAITSTGDADAADGGASMHVDWSVGPTAIDIGLDASWPGTTNVSGSGYAYVAFTLTESTAYNLSGLLSYGDGDATSTAAGYFYWSTSLYSSVTSANLWSTSATHNTVDSGTTTLTDLSYSGSWATITHSGSLTGTLAPGTYRLYSSLYFFGRSFSGTFDVTGGVTLTLGTTPVPEPASLVLAGSGLLALAAARRRRANAASPA